MVESHRPAEAPKAAVTLDEKSLALQGALPDILSQFQVTLGATLDLVEVEVETRDLQEVCRALKDDPRLAFNYLLCLSVVDYTEHLQVVYHLYSIGHKHKLVVKTNVSAEEPVAPSVVEIWPGADWFEREGHDLFGVVFEGHPNMAPLLLWEGFEGFPGRKSYEFHDYTEW